MLSFSTFIAYFFVERDAKMSFREIWKKQHKEDLFVSVAYLLHLATVARKTSLETQHS